MLALSEFGVVCTRLIEMDKAFISILTRLITYISRRHIWLLQHFRSHCPIFCKPRWFSLLSATAWLIERKVEVCEKLNKDGMPQ